MVLNFYETPNGEQPAKLFLNELSEKQRAKTIRDLKLLETCGNKLREPTSKFGYSDFMVEKGL